MAGAASSSKQLPYAVLEYLTSQMNSSSFSDDARESLQVAAECLASAYQISLNQAELKTTPSLEALFAQHAQPVDAKPADTKKASQAERAEKLKAEGNDLMKEEKYAEAVEKYTCAIEADGTNAVYYSNRAAAYNKLGLHPNSIADCDEAIRIDPNYSKAYGRKGLALSSLDRLQEAVDCYGKAAQLDPNNASYVSNMQIAQDMLAQRRGEAPGGPAGGISGGGPDLSGFAQFLNNPAFMNVAQSFMQNPNMQQMMQNLMNTSPSGGETGGASQGGASQGGASTGSGGGGSGGGGMESLLRAGQQMAERLQQENPDLVESLRSQYGQMGERDNTNENASPGDESTDKKPPQ